MRYDTSTPTYDGPAFKFASSEHRVTIVAVDTTNGDRRTESAANVSSPLDQCLRPPVLIPSSFVQGGVPVDDQNTKQERVGPVRMRTLSYDV